MKPVTGIERVTIKRTKNVNFDLYWLHWAYMHFD
jgi:hypothetical protein